MRLNVWSVVWVLASANAVHCAPAPSGSDVISPDAEMPLDGDEPDAGEQPEASVMMDAAQDVPIVPSGCPASQPIAPGTTLTGFLPAVDVDFVRIVDGDTAHFMYQGRETIVRFIYVNAEETHAPDLTQFGVETAAIVGRRLRPSRLMLAPQRGTNGQPALDMFGRTLALVFADGELVQRWMIQQGLSAYYTQFGCAAAPLHLSLLYGEAEARANRRGIWAPGHPTNYNDVLTRWIGRSTCRPAYSAPYCR